MPLIDPQIQVIFNEQLLSMLWLEESTIGSRKEEIYVPAILALFGWKAVPTKPNYSLSCESGCRVIPLSILATEKGFVQSWSQNENLARENNLVYTPDDKGWLADWAKPFMLHPINDHMEF